MKCEMFEASYIGETGARHGEVIARGSSKARFSEHWWPSSSNSKVTKSLHVEQCDHTVEMDNMEFLTKRRDGGRYSLPRRRAIIIFGKVWSLRELGWGESLLTRVKHNDDRKRGFFPLPKCRNYNKVDKYFFELNIFMDMFFKTLFAMPSLSLFQLSIGNVEEKIRLGQEFCSLDCRSSLLLGPSWG